jgi:hypothetical protein
MQTQTIATLIEACDLQHVPACVRDSLASDSCFAAVAARIDVRVHRRPSCEQLEQHTFTLKFLKFSSACFPLQRDLKSDNAQEGQLMLGLSKQEYVLCPHIRLRCVTL